jgi:Rab3 GTPase-activating protein catalytic subunit
MSNTSESTPTRKTKTKKSRKERIPGTGQAIEPASPQVDATAAAVASAASVAPTTSSLSAAAEVSTWTDFSVASPLERFAAQIESHMRKWHLDKADGANDSSSLAASGVEQSTELSLNGRAYSLMFLWRAVTPARSGLAVNVAAVPSHFSASMRAMADCSLDFPSEAHNLQRWFGVDRFVLLCPRADTVVDTSESTLLLSALSIAADACRCHVPVFVPLGDVWRGIYLGYECAESGVVLRYDTRAAKASPDFASLDSVLRFHFSRIGFTPADHSATTIGARLTFEKDTDDSSGAWRGREVVADKAVASPSEADGKIGAEDANAAAAAADDDDDDDEDGGVVWGQFSDPVDVLQLGALWPRFSVETFEDTEATTELFAENAPSWNVRSIYAENFTCQLRDSVNDVVYAHAAAVGVRTLSELFVTDSVKKAIAEQQQVPQEQAPAGERSLRSAADALARLAEPSATASASRRLLSGTLRTTMGAVSRVGSITKSLATSLHLDHLPGAEQLNATLHNIFSRARTRCVESLTAAASSLPPASRLGGAKAGTLFFSFALSAFSAAKLRPIALLWRQFASDIRWHWETASLLVGVDERDGACPIDLDQCLLQQKFELLNYCIRRKQAGRDSPAKPDDDADSDEAGAAAGGGGWDEFDIDVPDADEDGAGGEADGRDDTRGRVKRLELTLLGTDKPMYEPLTQDTGVATEDMLREREEMLSRLGTDEAAARLRTQLQTAGLLADMQAFKAANDGCQLADFVRWHSPNDWIDGELSARMRRDDNVWHDLWHRAKPVRAVDQKQLFDAEKEANRALHFIETLSPSELMTQVLATVLQSVPVLLGWDCTDATRDALQLPPVKSAVDALVANIAAAWPAERTQPLTREELEGLNDAFVETETLLSRATSLLQKLPRCVALVESLLKDGEAAVEREEERNALAALFVDAKTQRMPIDAQWREFVVRTSAPRERGGRATLQRTYALVGKNDFRAATVVCVDDDDDDGEQE